MKKNDNTTDWDIQSKLKINSLADPADAKGLDNPLEFDFLNCGSMSIRKKDGSGESVFLYPSQIRQLAAFLEISQRIA